MLTMLTGLIVKLVLPSVGTIIGGYAVGLLNTALKRAGIQLKADQEQAVRAKVREAIAFVEESKRHTSGPGQIPPQRAEDTAIGRLMPALPTLSADEIRDLIREELPAFRAATNRTSVEINSGLPGGGRR
jgi:hypothetical protein